MDYLKEVFEPCGPFMHAGCSMQRSGRVVGGVNRWRQVAPVQTSCEPSVGDEEGTP
jgi:hypothetical protein